MNLRKQSGQGLIEYIILVALVAVAAIGFVRIFQKNLNTQLANVTNAISGKEYRKHSGEAVTGTIDKKDFGNFMSGANVHGDQ